MTLQTRPTEALPCQSDPGLFFPDGVGAHNYDQAKKLCAKCPLSTRLGCLEYALENDERDGVWGGKTPKERRAIAAERRVSAGVPARRRGRRAA